MITRKDLFDFMLKQVKKTSDLHGDRMPQAFGWWFSTMFFPGVTSILIPDGAGDGKIDLLVTGDVANSRHYYILNTKFTNQYDKSSPVSFYDEITRYWQAFENSSNRTAYLENVVREPLRQHYRKLFRLYDEGSAKLYFITNHKINEAQYNSVKSYDVSTLHLDDVLQYVTEHIEGAMPETEPLLLSGISNVLTPATNESEVPTSIVFARLTDFIKYMEEDHFGLLFARNVRLWLGKTETNDNIRHTFQTAPKEFAYSNNGITILCKKHTHNPGRQELRLENPRVVNGSQTLHSIASVENPSNQARVMVRIIEVPPSSSRDLPQLVERRKEIIHKISTRSNQQNPIKRWNLVSNDDFQNELSRYFWEKKLYYERRQFEWKARKLEVTSVGIKKGPDIRGMTQLIASYRYDLKKLGPAIAHGQLNSLFDEEVYETIRNTSPTLAYQLYLLDGIVEHHIKSLRGKKQYINDYSGYIDLSLFTLICKILRGCPLKLKLGKEAASPILEREYRSKSRSLEILVKRLIDYIVAEYKKTKKEEMRTTDKQLTPANYFKSAGRINKLISKHIPKKLMKDILARFQ